MHQSQLKVEKSSVQTKHFIAVRYKVLLVTFLLEKSRFVVLFRQYLWIYRIDLRFKGIVRSAGWFQLSALWIRMQMTDSSRGL